MNSPKIPMQLRTSDRPDAERAASTLLPTASIQSKEASPIATDVPVAPAGSSGLGLLQKAKAVPADTLLKINPLRWKLEHQIAWIVACLLGAVVGVLYGFSHSQFGSVGAGQGVHFLFWLQHPEFYWHWASFGAVIAGLAFYLARLLKA
jgi:hypothetical protein